MRCQLKDRWLIWQNQSILVVEQCPEGQESEVTKKYPSYTAGSEILAVAPSPNETFWPFVMVKHTLAEKSLKHLRTRRWRYSGLSVWLQFPKKQAQVNIEGLASEGLDLLCVCLGTFPWFHIFWWKFPFKKLTAIPERPSVGMGVSRVSLPGKVEL